VIRAKKVFCFDNYSGQLPFFKKKAEGRRAGGKKLLDLASDVVFGPYARILPPRIKVFWFFFSKKNAFLSFQAAL